MTYMWNIKKRNRLTDLENKVVITSGEGGTAQRQTGRGGHYEVI